MDLIVQRDKQRYVNLVHGRRSFVSSNNRFLSNFLLTPKATGAGNQSVISRKSSPLQRMRPVEFLNGFSAITREESFSMNFDYFSMHLRCNSLLQELAWKNEAFGKIYLGHFPELITPNKLPLTTYMTLFPGSGEGASLGASNSTGPGYVTPLLLAAGKIVESLVNKEGSIEVEKLKKIIPAEWNAQDISR
jgi:hypothetical protein